MSEAPTVQNIHHGEYIRRCATCRWAKERGERLFCPFSGQDVTDLQPCHKWERLPGSDDE